KSITVNAQAVVYPGGTGSALSPYQITDCARLQGMDQNLSAHYVLTADVDCSETTGWNGGAGFKPIGNSPPFTGTLNGAGHAIDALHIIRADDDPNTNGYSLDTDEFYVGLFGRTQGAEISNLNITDSKVKGYAYVGGIIGSMDGGSLTNSTFNIGVAQNDCDPGLCVWARFGFSGGGLVGRLESGTVSNSRTAGPVKGSGSVIGGLVGEMTGGTLEDSSSSSDTDGGSFIGGAIGQMTGGTATRVHVSGSVDTNTLEGFKDGRYGGGFVGALEGGVITESYATGNVFVEVESGGGFAGVLFSNSNNAIRDSYATGNVSSSSGYYMGGFVGKMYEGIITRAYASGSVTGDSTVGGFAGLTYNSPTISDSFAVGEVSSVSAPSAGFIASIAHGGTYTHTYFDIARTTQVDCSADSMSDCTGVNALSAQPNYFVDLRNDPFTQSGSMVWDNEDVWYFDATNLPVLRQGSNTTPSVTITDDDEDGVSSAIEDAAPNGGDANHDGIADSTQANVTSFVNPTTQQYTVLAVDSGCSITAISAASEASKPVADAGYVYPTGLVSYVVDCGTPGYTAHPTLYFYGVSAGSAVARKYNSTTQSYGAIPGATIIQTADYTSVSYSVLDGGTLDEDGVADGIIIDPAGLAVPAGSGLAATGVNAGLIIMTALSLVVTSGLAISQLRKKHTV
ncbi:MAG: choice-of-anchor U domain-containing protein, partial [Candidatus Saccharimonas sp.]